ncbi:Sodium channel protein Nach-like [Homarus americanus]|uniref:Sodium channel protein Nach-like n=1 Tax=Homarus americanus TaxID=6706 RepID=A0A8J5MSP8_HOMAM|nr:Sodium channel protein Nach-like [Homarus americanus]
MTTKTQPPHHDHTDMTQLPLQKMTTTARRKKTLHLPHLQYDRDFIRRRSFGGMSELMCQESTAHGIGHVWNNRRNLLGVFWFIATLTMFILLLIVAGRLFLDFIRRDPKSQASFTTVKISTTGELQLPSGVLCNRQFFSRRKLQAFNISSGLANYLIVTTGSPFILKEGFLVSAEGQTFLQESHEQLLHLLRTHNLTYTQLIDAISYSCEEVVLRCGLGTTRTNSTECCKAFIPMPTMAGKCYTYYADAHHTQAMEGEYLGFSLFVNITQDDYPVGQGVPLLPRVYTAVDVALTVVRLSTLIVRDTGMKTVFDWSETHCTPSLKVNYLLDKESFLNTEPNCDVGATRYCFRRVCNCSSYGLDNSDDNWPLCPLNVNQHCYGLMFTSLNMSYPITYKIPTTQERYANMTQSQANQCWQEAKQRCRRMCARYDYTYQTTHLPIKDYLREDINNEFALANGSDVAVLVAFFPNLRYTEVKCWRSTIDEFMSELGGYTGVFLGCSFITFIEIFVFLGIFITFFIREVLSRLKTSVKPSPSKSQACTE